MQTQTGKKRKTLAGNAEQLFRIIQSIPSPKAEPFKQWLINLLEYLYKPKPLQPNEDNSNRPAFIDNFSV